MESLVMYRIGERLSNPYFFSFNWKRFNLSTTYKKDDNIQSEGNTNEICFKREEPLWSKCTKNWRVIKMR